MLDTTATEAPCFRLRATHVAFGGRADECRCDRWVGDPALRTI